MRIPSLMALSTLAVLAACPATDPALELTASTGATTTGSDATTDPPTSGPPTGEPTTTEPTTTKPGDETTAATDEPSTGELTTGEPGCVDLGDCQVEDPACRTALACEAGQCVFEDMPEGTATPDQQPGDCVVVVCDGAGVSGPIADADDVPDDGIVCTLDACDGTTPVHTPGQTACYSGPGGTADIGACASGVQMCDEQGFPTGPCVGEQTPQTETCDPDEIDEDCDGATNEDGAACVCSPGAQIPCYTGPAPSEGHGACHGGTATCDPDGLGLGPCVGEVVPALEDCDGGGDEDCDGAVDESGPSCACGDGILSLGEHCDDGNLVEADGCPADCTFEALAVYAGPSQSCAILSGGAVKCWGFNVYGELGLGDHNNRGDVPGEMGDALPTIDLGTGASALDLTMGAGHICALLKGGAVKCWGSGAVLGLGDPSVQIGDSLDEMGDNLLPVDLGGPALAIDSSHLHMCAVLVGGVVKCWGQNAVGKLGLGDKLDRGDNPGEMGKNLPAVDLGANKTAIAVSAASEHTCALLSDHSVKCWGLNIEGQLGLGDKVRRGDDPGEMGDNLPTVALGAAPVLALSSRDASNCALVQGGKLKCWGEGAYGELGNGKGVVIGDGPGEMGDNLPFVDLGLGKLAAQVSAGNTTCARLTDGGLKCWGEGTFGATGHGNEDFDGNSPNTMGDNLPLTDLGVGVLAGWIGHEAEHTCVATGSGRVKCFGYNGFGALGLGDTGFDFCRGDDPGEMGDDLAYVPMTGP